MQSVLIIFTHPNLQQSNINRHLIEQARQLDFVTVHDLCEAYPDGIIDIETEQAILSEYENIVFQHPFYWYSVPALQKEWFDLVLQYNFAYGPSGNLLQNKNWLSVISTGGGQQAYCSSGHNRFTMDQLLTPFEQTAYLCQMNYLPPFIVHGTRKLFADKPRLEQVTQDYVEYLTAMSNGEIDVKAPTNNAKAQTGEM